jgi:SAM-dependent methyltransferase
MAEALREEIANDSPDAAASVAAMRERKLARLRFRYPAAQERIPGEAISFLSPALAEEFRIPDEMPVSAHPYTAPILALIASNRDRLFLDVGAGVRPVYHANIVNLDIYRSISTDVISVAEDMPFADEQFDFVLSFAVMEHVKRPWEVAREIGRVLKPGGTVIIDYPFMSPMHGYPHHYFNATPLGNRSLFEPFCDITSVEIGWHHHPAVAVQWMLTVWRNGLAQPLAEAFADMTVRDLIEADLTALLEQPVATELHADFKMAIAGGSTLVGVKRPGAAADIRPGK